MNNLQDSAQKQLKQLVEAIEHLEEEKAALSGDIREKYLEVKAFGFDVKIVRKLVSVRKLSEAERQEQEALLATYMHALGMLDGTPMGDHIAKQDDETTISINGGPEMPFSVAKKALRVVKNRARSGARA